MTEGRAVARSLAPGSSGTDSSASGVASGTFCLLRAAGSCPPIVPSVTQLPGSAGRMKNGSSSPRVAAENVVSNAPTAATEGGSARIPVLSPRNAAGSRVSPYAAKTRYLCAVSASIVFASSARSINVKLDGRVGSACGCCCASAVCDARGWPIASAPAASSVSSRRVMSASIPLQLDTCLRLPPPHLEHAAHLELQVRVDLLQRVGRAVPAGRHIHGLHLHQ